MSNSKVDLVSFLWYSSHVCCKEIVDELIYDTVHKLGIWQFMRKKHDNSILTTTVLVMMLGTQLFQELRIYYHVPQTSTVYWPSLFLSKNLNVSTTSLPLKLFNSSIRQNDKRKNHSHRKFKNHPPLMPFLKQEEKKIIATAWWLSTELSMFCRMVRNQL